MLSTLDGFLDRISMYKAVLYYLIALLVSAIVLSFVGVVPYSWLAISYSAGVLVLSAVAANALLAWGFGAFAGSFSTYITALILAVIITPVVPGDVTGSLGLALIGVLAVASKYLFTYKKKHIFNPAGFGAAAAGLIFSNYASWWIAGTTYLIPIVAIGGLLVARKIFRLDTFYAFAGAALFTSMALAQAEPLRVGWQIILHAPLLFMGLTMLTDPATMPPTRDMRIAYGLLVGIWFTPGMHIGSLYFSPELALLLGNLFVFVVSPKGRYALSLTSRTEVAQGTYELDFNTDKPIAFEAGQYLEWTVKGKKDDSRGNRRYLSIVNAPEEDGLRMAFRISNPSSAFKKSLMELPLGGEIAAGQLAGDFILPKNPRKKLAYIAGGIGITPVRSHIAHLLYTGGRDAILLYSNKTEAEIAYRDLFEQARERGGIDTLYVVSNGEATLPYSHKGIIDADLIRKAMPDYLERTFYISGPSPMVDAMLAALDTLGVSGSNIKTDYFPGYA